VARLKEVASDVTARQPPCQKLVRMFRSQENDLKLARKCVIATVANVEVIPLVQNKVEDTGFTDLDIILMGADKVFIHTLSDTDVLKTLEEANECFDHLFSNIVRWDKKVVPFHRGA